MPYCLPQSKIETYWHYRLTHPAKTEGGEGDTQLRHRQGYIYMLYKAPRIFGLLVSLLTEHFKLAGPDLRHGKLCRYKESVHKNQEYYYQRIK